MTKANPLSILVIDDDTSKVARVIEALRRFEGGSAASIQECRDSRTAKQLMADSTFDLVVVDVVLPERIDSDPNPEGGVVLLREIMEQRKVLPPGYIVGLTAHEELFPAARDAFDARGWSLIHYDAGSSAWIERLGWIIDHILWAKQAVHLSDKDYASDICIVCALPDPELKSVLSIGWSWCRHMIKGDHTLYYEGTFMKGERRINAFAAAAPRMGLAATAALTAKMIQTFLPRYCCMTGIAAGIQGKCNLGDVLAADQTWDYSSGKFEIVDGKGMFSSAPYQLSLDVESRNHLVELASDEAMLDRISSAWCGERPSSRLRLILGPVASGGAVVADPSKVREILLQQRKLVGIEMETYAMFAAAAESARPRPLAMSLKSVSDFADEKKSDGYQHYAAYTSAQIMREFCERFL